MKWLVFVLLAASIESARLDGKWDQFLTDLHKSDQNAARTLVVGTNKNFIVKELPPESTSSSYVALENLLESRNFNGYFEFLKNTDLYEKMVSELMKTMNLTPGKIQKMIKEMWDDYFRNESNSFKNWYGVYLEQKNGKLRKMSSNVIDQNGVYAAWFSTADGANVKRTFFHGTSPEFDLIAFTLCALETQRGQESKRCGFELDGQPVAVWVSTKHVRDLVTITMAEPRRVPQLQIRPKDGDRDEREMIIRKTTTRKPKPGNEEFQKFVDKMWEADVDRAPEDAVKLNWQQKVGKHGNLNPLFTFVNESIFERPVYQALLNVWNHKIFEPAVCKEEVPVEGQKKAVLQRFFQTMTNHTIFKVALEYLQQKGVYSPAKHEKFMDNLFTLWFGVYSRCHAPLGSSGFEHVFVGEKKGNTVDGHHNWVRYYLQEKAGQIQYKGYYGYDEGVIGTIQYDWDNAHKQKGGFFFYTSPAFDFAIYSTCVLTQSGNQHCRFKVKNNDLFVTSFQQRCNEGVCISTSYAGIDEQTNFRDPPLSKRNSSRGLFFCFSRPRPRGKMIIEPAEKFEKDLEPLVLDREIRKVITVTDLLYRVAVFALIITLLTLGPFIFASIFYDEDLREVFDRQPNDLTFDQHFDEFVKFKSEFNKIYDNVDEELKRFQIFRKSLKTIEEYEKLEDNTEFGINEFADLSDDEFQQMLMPKDFYHKLRRRSSFIKPYSHFIQHEKPKRKHQIKFDSASPYPPHFDWREKGVVTPVKSQFNCGSCWAFAAIGTVETSYAIAHGELRNLSEQELLDCDLANNACNGGDDDKAFRFIHEHGLMREEDYPYVAQRQNSCLLNEYSGPTTKLDLAYFIASDENAMLEWLVNFGPINVGINVPPDMKLYKGGVYTPSSWDCKNNILGTHALNIMGYGTWEDGQKYWIVKNSWGPKYGIEDGYVYMARGENSCGIEDEPIGILC
ncbi:unnamed protein product [Bursaphelenchus xylophilus]|uniref:(pine wood nematode) hypothetical protein n=1 Tax=Bursaphelenchus xylophilus TaxID=6326 RepID=A0A1I7RK73_BURXY|nr:unnamed protein product [Bursaphelenchus xylophilus]CAG9131453.1 unnamed protein product [Bursaphelenchus xylophilus]